MQQIADLAKQILEKLVDFFDIFDLSFFISGVMVLLGGLLIIRTSPGFPVPDWSPQLTFAAVVIACYLLGLIAFAAGRGLRQKAFSWIYSGGGLDEWFWSAASYHQILEEDPLVGYSDLKELIEGKDAGFANAIYTRLWVELRQNNDLKASYGLIRRYWVLSATYDGMAVALFFWSLVVLLVTLNGLFDGTASRLGIHPGMMCAGFMLMFWFLMLTCFREAKRFQRYQVEELVATIAYMQQKGGGLNRLRRAGAAVAEAYRALPSASGSSASAASGKGSSASAASGKGSSASAATGADASAASGGAVKPAPSVVSVKPTGS